MEVLGFEVVFVAGGIQVWWVEEEDGVFAVVSGDEVAEVFTLYYYIDQSLPGSFECGLHGEDIEAGFAGGADAEGLAGDMAAEG